MHARCHQSTNTEMVAESTALGYGTQRDASDRPAPSAYVGQAPHTRACPHPPPPGRGVLAFSPPFPPITHLARTPENPMPPAPSYRPVSGRCNPRATDSAGRRPFRLSRVRLLTRHCELPAPEWPQFLPYAWAHPTCKRLQIADIGLDGEWTIGSQNGRWEIRGPHQIRINTRGSSSPFSDGPHDQRLTATGVTSNEYSFNISGEVRLPCDISSIVNLDA